MNAEHSNTIRGMIAKLRQKRDQALDMWEREGIMAMKAASYQYNKEIAALEAALKETGWQSGCGGSGCG